MNTKFDLEDKRDDGIVYVRAVKPNELTAEMRAQTDDIEELVAVHASNGDRLALINGRRLAFELARQHDMTPVDVH